MADGGISSSEWDDKILPFLTKAETKAEKFKTFTDKSSAFTEYFGTDIQVIPGETIDMQTITNSIKKALEFLQYFCHFNYDDESTIFSMQVLGENRFFELKGSHVGEDNEPGYQILIRFKNKSNPLWKMTPYSDILPRLKVSKVHQKKLAEVILHNLKTSRPPPKDLPDEVKGVMEHAARFVLLTHICESAVPLYDDLKVYRQIVDKKRRNKHIPNINKKKTFKKTGRIPLADKITRAKLRIIATGKSSFEEQFNENNFPIVKPNGGTALGRQWVLNGEFDEDLSDDEDESSNSGDVSGIERGFNKLELG